MNRTGKSSVKLLIASVLVLGAISLSAFRKNPADSVTESAQEAGTTQISKETAEETTSSSITVPSIAANSTAETVISLPAKPLSEIKYPELKLVRSQTAANPHGTAPALIEFAEDLSPHMEKALEDPSYASEFASYLEDCASGAAAEQSPFSLRAYCAGNVSTLAEKHGGSLTERSQALRKKLPKGVITILRALEQS